MVTKICAGLLCVVLFAGMLTGCQINKSESAANNMQAIQNTEIPIFDENPSDIVSIEPPSDVAETELEPVIKTEIVPPNDPNTRGNSIGNVANESYVVQSGDWIYYSTNFDIGGERALCKMKTDGTENQILIDDLATYLNVIGDWIYYNEALGGINRIKTDGTGKTQVCEDWALYTNIVGDWIYYNNGSDNNYIYKIKTDGTGREQLNSEKSDEINVVGDWIYYNTNDDYSYKFCKIKIDGTGWEQIVNHRCLFANVVGDWIYYTNGGIYKINIDGTGDEMINDEWSSKSLNVTDDWIYYCASSDNGNLYKVKIDGTGKELLSDNKHISNVHVFGDWIFYIKNLQLYKIKTDGTKEEAVVFPITLY